MMRFIISLLCTLFLSIPSYADNRKTPTSDLQIRLSFAPLVKKSSPSVVNIYTQTKTKSRSASPFSNDPLFKHFFNDGLFGDMMHEKIQRSLGSGVIIDPNGKIITNNHVVKDSDKITVVLADRREYSATIELVDKKTDLAILKIDTKGEPLQAIKIANSDHLEIGDLVLAIGNPFGVGQTVTSGIVSALARTTSGVSDFQFFIQTDAAINPGNSGGALIDINGELVGINTAIYSRSGGSNGIGFAIPSNMVSSIKKNQVVDGHVIRPWLGITTQDITNDIAGSLGIKIPRGVLISKMHSVSPIKKGDLRIGDVITEVQGIDISDSNELKFRIATYAIGELTEFTIIRGKTEMKRMIRMIAPPEIPSKDMRILSTGHLMQGVTIANISPALAGGLDLNDNLEGVIVTKVSRPSISHSLGFKERDIIEQINGEHINSTKQLNNLLNDSFTDDDVTGWKIKIIRDNKAIITSIQK